MNDDPEARSPLSAAEARAGSGPSSADAGPARSRRQLLAAGGGLGAAALLAGCTSKVAPPSNVKLPKHSPQTPRDVHVLNGLLALEYRAIAAYTASTPRLPQPPTPPTTVAQQPSQQPAHSDPPPPALELTLPLASAAAAHFLSQELAHVTELKGFIKQVGVHPVRPEPSYDLGHPRTKQDVLSLLRRIEEAQVAAYLDAVTALSPGKLRSAIAAILANHAQQLSVWRAELGLPPVPSAFVTGRE